jgi:hypothetical protein
VKLTIEGEAFDFDPQKLTNVEGMAIENVTGMLFGEWADALTKGSMLAQTALVWVVKKRKEPTLRFGDVSFDLSSISIQEDPADPKEPAEDSVPAA